MRHKLLIPAALVFALAGSTALGTGNAFAQSPTPPAPPAGAPPAGGPSHPGQAGPAQRPPRTFASHIDGRIAYLKAELKITPAQEPQFDKVAQSMRANDADMRKDFEANRGQHGQPISAVDQLDRHLKMEQTRARNDERYLAAFKPLYDSLSPDQQKAADRLLAPHFGPSRFARRPI